MRAHNECDSGVNWLLGKLIVKFPLPASVKKKYSFSFSVALRKELQKGM